MWSIFHLILYEKNFLESGAPVCLLDLEVCQFVALAVDVGGRGAFVDLGAFAVGSSFGDFMGN